MHTYVAYATARVNKQGTTAHISIPQLRTLACATFAIKEDIGPQGPMSVSTCALTYGTEVQGY